MSTDAEIRQLAAEVRDAIGDRLADSEFAGHVVVHPKFLQQAVVVQITDDPDPDDGSPCRETWVPAEVWSDTAARAEVVAHLCRPYLDAAT